MDIISVDTPSSIRIYSEIEKITMCTDAGGTNGSYDTLILKYSTSGVLQWQNAYGGEGDDGLEEFNTCAVRGVYRRLYWRYCCTIVADDLDVHWIKSDVCYHSATISPIQSPICVQNNM